MPERKKINPCYFCGSTTVRFAEHWKFCPECAAIYTNMIIWEKNCKHIKDRTPVARSDCWFKNVRDKKVYIKEVNGVYVCSKCGKPVEADGW